MTKSPSGICQGIPHSILSILTYYGPQTDIPIKSYTHFNFRLKKSFRRTSLLHPKLPLGLAVPLVHDYLAISSGGLPFSPAAVASPLPRVCTGRFCHCCWRFAWIYVVKQPHVGICFKTAPFAELVCKRSPIRAICQNVDLLFD